MKFIIDLLEDVREQIGNHEEYIVTAGLLLAPEPFGQPAGVDVDSAPVSMWTLRRSTYGQLSL